MAKLKDLVVAIGANTTDFDKNIGKAINKIKYFGKNTKRLGKSLSMNVTAPIAALGFTAVKAFQQQSKAIAQMEAGLKSTGATVGYTSQQLQTMASNLQAKTLFGDEDILQNATAQLLTFTNITGDQFARTQQAALDLATRLDGDLKGASIQLGKALNDPVANLSALSRSGIQFSDEQKEVIKSMAETGRLAEAQTLILDELNKQYGGSAEAAAKADGGFTQLANSFGDLQEQFGAILVDVLRPIIDWANQMVSRFAGLSKETQKYIVIASGIAAALGPLLFLLPTIIGGISALISPVTLVVAAIAGAVALIVAYWDEIKEYFTTGGGSSFLNGVVDYVNAYLNLLYDYFKFLYNSVVMLWERFGPAIVEALTTAFNIVQRIFGKLFNAIGTLFSAFSDLFQGNWGRFAQKMANVFIDAVGALLLGLNFGLGQMLGLVDKGLQALGMDSNLQEGFANIIDGMIESLDGLKYEFDQTKSEGKDFLGMISDFAGGFSFGGGGRATGGIEVGEPVTSGPQVGGLLSNLENASADAGPQIGGLLGDLAAQSFAVGMEKAEEAHAESMDRMKERNETFQSSVQALAGTLQSQFSNLFTGLMNGTQTFGEFMKQILMDLLIKLASMVAAFLVISALTGGAAGSLGGFLTEGFGLGGLIPMASGGIVSGPTAILAGEYGGARTNPEVIAPLDKLQSMIQGSGGGNVTVTGRISGSDILLSSERSNIYRNRVRGF